VHDPVSAISTGQLANIMFGSVFLFIGLAACAFAAAVSRREGARFFVWLGIWSMLRAARLLAESPAVVGGLAALAPGLRASVLDSRGLPGSSCCGTDLAGAERWSSASFPSGRDSHRLVDRHSGNWFICFDGLAE
jgi:hypothetical protein